MIYFLVTGIGYECVGATEWTDTLRISVRVTIKLNIKESFKIWMLSFPERSKYLALNGRFFDKEKIYFEAGAINTDETLEENIL